VEDKKRAEYRRNIFVFVVLAALTFIEFAIAINLAGPAVPLFIIALLKAGLIVNYFMHIYRLWQPEEHE
jgi:cytochrome c oxidase subunit 4